MRTGADNLIETLFNAGLDICFTNPGTSEMHLVSALDKKPQIRSVLCLFEGVATGAADGYSRMSKKFSSTLLHLGPGLANGIANLHNAQKAQTSIINLVGQHKLSHMEYDIPLTSDIEGLANTFSGYVKTITEDDQVVNVTLEAIRNSQNAAGNISTLVIPSDIAWNESKLNCKQTLPVSNNSDAVDYDAVEKISDILLSTAQSVIFINTTALDKQVVDLLGKIKSHTQCRIVSELFVSKIRKGAGEVEVERIPFRQPDALAFFEGTQEVILIGAHPPVTFFGYPDQDNPSMLPTDCNFTRLTRPEEFSLASVQALVKKLDVGHLNPEVLSKQPLLIETGELTTAKVGRSLAALLPENAIVVDDGITSTFSYWPFFKHANRHDWLYTTGGSIGQALPVSIGAAIAEPSRKVICLSGDGSAMYTIQSIWTQVRENLSITNIIFSNRSYRILNTELTTVGITDAGDIAKKMLDLSKPNIDFAQLARSMGAHAVTVTNMEEFNIALEGSLDAEVPWLIDVIC
jgi:acetolactate synthase-1/2/3 large subunit